MCIKCKTSPVYEFTNKRKVCKTCYIRWFEKKFLYTIRKFGMIQKGDIIGYKTKKDFRGAALENLMKMYSIKAPIKIVKLPTKIKTTKVALDSTADSESLEILNIIVKKDISGLEKNFPTNNKKIKPLYLFLDKEVLLYAKLKNIRFKKNKNKENKLKNFIDDLEKKHPEIKFAIVQGALKLN